MRNPNKIWHKFALLAPFLFALLSTLVFPVHSEAPIKVFLPVVFTPDIPLANGDFESGLLNWILSPTSAQLIFNKADLPEGVFPHSGSHIAWLGDHQVPNQTTDYSITQNVNIPEYSPILHFWVMSYSAEFCPSVSDVLQILVNNNLIDWWPICKDQNTFTWRHQISNLKIFSGYTVDLTIRMVTNNVFPSEVYLDDFSFSSH
ncbi:MAG TPA: hypothetical protein VN452_08370 [Longilinea sp.]|nr:hypothetical protein [Longilinea sp.]